MTLIVPSSKSTSSQVSDSSSCFLSPLINRVFEHRREEFVLFAFLEELRQFRVAVHDGLRLDVLGVLDGDKPLARFLAEHLPDVLVTAQHFIGGGTRFILPRLDAPLLVPQQVESSDDVFLDEVSELGQRLPHQVVGFNAVGELVFFEVGRKRIAEHDRDFGVVLDRDARSRFLHVRLARFGHLDRQGCVFGDLVPDALATRLLVVQAVLSLREVLLCAINPCVPRLDFVVFTVDRTAIPPSFCGLAVQPHANLLVRHDPPFAGGLGSGLQNC